MQVVASVIEAKTVAFDDVAEIGMQAGGRVGVEQFVGGRDCRDGEITDLDG